MRIIRHPLAIAAALVFAGTAFVHAARSVEASESEHTINQGLRVDTQTSVGDLSSVNGGVDLADDASADDVSSVNGSIELGNRSHANDVSAVNGSINAGQSVTVDKDVETVNGEIRIADGSRINGEISSVNGDINLIKTNVRRNVSTVNGNVSMVGSEVGGLETVWGDLSITGSRVNGDLRIVKPRNMGWNWGSKPKQPVIVIGAGSVVTGRISLEHPATLYVHQNAQVGAIVGGTAQRFSGDRAPTN